MFLHDLLSRVLDEAKDVEGLEFGRYIEMIGDIAQAERDLAEADYFARSSVESIGSVLSNQVEQIGSADDGTETESYDGGAKASQDTDVVESGDEANDASLSDDVSSGEGVSSDADVDTESDAEPLTPNGTVDSSIVEGGVEHASYGMTQVSSDEYENADMPFGIGESRGVAITSEE
jgi:hypothetical protein